jgi:hypothetical protein
LNFLTSFLKDYRLAAVCFDKKSAAENKRQQNSSFLAVRKRTIFGFYRYCIRQKKAVVAVQADCSQDSRVTGEQHTA